MFSRRIEFYKILTTTSLPGNHFSSHFIRPQSNNATYCYAAFIRTLRTRQRRATIVGRRRTLQPDAVGRGQHRLLQTLHDRSCSCRFGRRWGSETLHKSRGKSLCHPLIVISLSWTRLFRTWSDLTPVVDIRTIYNYTINRSILIRM